MHLLGVRNIAVNGAATGTLMWRVLAVLVLGAMLAQWTWALFTPRNAPVLPAEHIASDLQAERMFGSSAASSVTVQAALNNVRLVGVFSGSPGFAVLELDGKRQIGLEIGKEIVAGAKLVEVAADHVIIERGGVRQSVPLVGNSSAISSAVDPLLQTPLDRND